MPFVLRDGVRLHWRIDGRPEAPPLLLSNSLGTDLAIWEPILPRLLEYFRVVRMDTRGHGASDAPAGPYDLDQLVDDTCAVADAAGLGQFAFCGVSMGGAIGMRLAMRHPERVSALLLANTAPSFPQAVFDQRIARIAAEGLASVCDGVMERFFSARFRALDPVVVATARQTFLQLDATGYLGCCHAVRNTRLEPGLARITAPVLVITGDVDESTPPARGEAIAAAIPGARLVALPAAHLSHVELPAAFCGQAIPFLLGTLQPQCTALHAADNPRAAETVQEGFARGMARRRRTLGDAWVDARLGNPDPLTAPFQQYITRYAWDEIWNRPELDPRTRRLLVLAITASLGRWEEYDLHAGAALRGGIEVAELREVLMQTAVYAGVPAANTAFTHLKRLIDAEESMKAGSSSSNS